MHSRMVHLVRFSPRPTEGGAVRDNAFHDYFHSKTGTRTITLSKNRILNLVKAASLLFCKNHTILLHLTSMGFPILNNGIIGRLSGEIMLWWLKVLLVRNRVIIEVNDLYTEQARDLEVPLPINFARIEFRLFQMQGIIFAFASESMRLFATHKYGLDPRKVLTIINGESLNNADEPTPTLAALFHKSDNGVRYVYSGTLNRGRSIETMIEAFKNAPAALILLGNGGEWLKEVIAPYSSNIQYLGII
jgi:glycosyltransferase involved in cell wall biosynthesis